MFLRVVPVDTNIRFMRLRTVSFGASLLAAVLSIGLFFAVGLNYGIDFRGGTLIEIKTDGPAEVDALRGQLNGLGLGDVEVQEFGAPDDVMIRIQQQDGGDEAQQAALQSVRDALGDGVDYRRVEVVGPRVSGELVQNGIIGVLTALVGVLLYIWFRFEWHFAVGAIVATIHDVVLTIGMFSALQLDFALASIAAILTIVGYSLNDTVVVYDRVRENLRRYKKRPLAELLDLSINQMLSRTILTSLTTLLALVSLYIFGGEVLRSFVFAMIWGVVVGTYSSIFIAAPILLWLGLRTSDVRAPGEAADDGTDGASAPA